ncbi:MAG: DUF3106 domain-containing protein [Rhodocyclaceae bacterium]|nr:DUF3106 domain-containing protein [Rhodocyclaceae bacterium]
MGQRILAILGLIGALVTLPAAAYELPMLKQPSWHELSPQQRQILAPLAAEWDQMEAVRRKKWVGIAGRYPHMTAEEQTRIQYQMREWIRLSPQQRIVAREKYKALRNAPADQRANIREQWLRYQELPGEEKLRLQEEAARQKEEARKQAHEKAKRATSVLSAKVAKPGYPVAPIQQAPAPVSTLTPKPVAPAETTPAHPKEP